MLKVRRVHIVNAGYEEATFDGETFDFRSVEDGEPAHCVLHAENGTGKTTALGLIFNMAVPKEARFLPHLVKPDYEFADYFQRGVGIVAVEWHDPAGRHPVTIHFVVPQFKAGDRQTWRRWALFRSGEELAFDDLPLKGVAGHARTLFGGRDDVAQWLRDGEARFADSCDFEVATTQDTWRRILERHGIDTALMDSQLEFNRQEGGLDSFLRIPAEEEFVARFLSLCLVTPDRGTETIAEPVCAQVRAIVARMRGYDKLVAKRGLLGDLSRAFEPFVDAARTWRERRRAAVEAGTRAAAVKQAAIQRANALQAEADEADESARNHAGQLEKRKEEVARVAIEIDAANLALAELQSDAALARREAAVAAAKDAEKSRARLAAARDLRDILASEVEIATYQKDLALAEQEAAGPRRQAHGNGARLKAMIEVAIGEQRDAVARAQATAAAADAERQEARRRCDEHVAESVVVQRRDALLEGNIAHADSELGELAADGIVHPGESVVAAIVRLGRDGDEAHAAAQSAADRAAGHEAAERAAVEAVGHAEAERREALIKAEAERSATARADSMRDALLGQDTWRNHLGDKVPFGPDAAAAAQTRARERLDEARREHERADLMRNDADRISRHRVAAVDRNVDLVLARLADNGFRSAMAAATWLAEMMDNPVRLRAFASADPVAFAGVFVQEVGEQARLLELDFSGLALDRPVAILPPAENPSGGIAFCVIPERAEAYDTAAAEALVEDLAGKVSESEAAAEAAQAGADALATLRASIEGWMAEWGGGRLETRRQRAAELEAAAKTAEGRVTIERQRASDERSAAAEQRTMSAQEAARGVEARQAKARAERWQRRHGEHLAEWRSERETLKNRLATLAEQAAQEQARADEAQHKAEQARGIASERQRELDGLAAEAQGIEFHDAASDAEACSLDDARVSYRTSADVYRRVMEDRLGPLQGTLTAKREALDQQNARWRRDHGAFAAERAVLAVEAADTALEERLVASVVAEKLASEAVGRAKAEAERLQVEARRHRAQFVRHGHAGSDARAALEGLQQPDLLGVVALAEDRRRNAMVEMDRLSDAIAEARERAARSASEAVRLRDRAQVLPDGPAPAFSLPLSLAEALAEVDTAHTRLSRALDEMQRGERVLVEAYDGFRREARSHRDRGLEAVLVDTLIANEAEPAGEDAERLQRLLSDRIATIQQEIDEYEADRNRAVGEMDGLLLAAISLFQRAVSRGVVPAQVPRFGGRRILAMSFRPPSAEGESGVALRRHLCQQMLIDYVAADEVPQTDHAMAAALVERYARAVQMKSPDEPALGLRLLKSNDHGRIHHLPVAAFKASAGETLTSAMLLYLLVARLRSEGRASQRTRIGGVLILDNPLGKASNTLFLRMQVALAEAMDVQLIFTTAVKDWSAIGEFPQVVKLRKEATDPATGRIFVKATHQWLGSSEQSAAPVLPAMDEAAE